MSWCRLVRTPNPKLKEEKFYFLFSVNLWFYSDFFFFFGLEPILIRIERCRRAAAAVLPSQWLAPVELLRLHRCRRTQKTYILEITFWIDGGRQCVHCIHSFIKKVNKKKRDRRNEPEAEWELSVSSLWNCRSYFSWSLVVVIVAPTQGEKSTQLIFGDFAKKGCADISSLPRSPQRRKVIKSVKELKKF